MQGMPQKTTSKIARKLTESEQELLASMAQGYQLETDSLGGNPVLRRLKDDEVLRAADANASTVKALEQQGLIEREESGDPLTIAWRLTSGKTPPTKAKRR